MDEDSVLEFLTSLEAMDLPDRIEEVNARILEKIVQETDFVAVLFCKYQLIVIALLTRLGILNESQKMRNTCADVSGPDTSTCSHGSASK